MTWRRNVVAVFTALTIFTFALSTSVAQADKPPPKPPNCHKTKTCTTTTTGAPTTTTTAPTTTTTTTPSSGCTNPKIINEGEAWGYYEPDGSLYLIHNNSWNDTAGGNSVITACDYDDWYLISDTPDHADLSVQTYPNVHRDYNDIALSSITSARFAATGPHCIGCIWNMAFDVWIGDGLSHELMIWTENWGQRPAGNQIDVVFIGGQQYQVWRSGSGDGGIFTYLSVTPQLAGTMPLSLFFADVRARGWTPTTTWQVDFGVEIVDTNGNPERFTFTDFFIND